jgi:hypothetical protein
MEESALTPALSLVRGREDIVRELTKNGGRPSRNAGTEAGCYGLANRQVSTRVLDKESRVVVCLEADPISSLYLWPQIHLPATFSAAGLFLPAGFSANGFPVCQWRGRPLPAIRGAN